MNLDNSTGNGLNTTAQIQRNAPAQRINQQHRGKKQASLAQVKKNGLRAAVWNLCAAQSQSGSADLDKSPAGAQRPALC